MHQVLFSADVSLAHYVENIMKPQKLEMLANGEFSFHFYTITLSTWEIVCAF